MNIESILSQLALVTQKTAGKVHSHFGKMDKQESDHIAVEAMREALHACDFESRVILGEGEKDEAAMLYEDEILGKGDVKIDLAVDPLECTTNFSKGLPNSMSVIAFTERGGLARVPGTYMEQWIGPHHMKAPFDPSRPLKENLEILGDSLGKTFEELMIVVQERPRHESLIKSLRDFGCGVSLIESGSISTVIDICLELGDFDALIGTYGAPEGLISAMIAKATGGEFKGIVKPHDDKFREKWLSYGRKENELLDKDDFVPGQYLGVIATGLSSNHFLKGVRKINNVYIGETLIISNHGYKIIDFETT